MLLSHPCGSHLTSLKVHNLRYDCLAPPPQAATPSFLSIVELNLEFWLEDEYPRRRGILGYLLAWFPHISRLTITTNDTRRHTNSPETDLASQQEARSANIRAGTAEQNLPLTFISASVLDISLLGLPYPKLKQMHIVGIDLLPAQYERGLMDKVFNSAVLEELSITFSLMRRVPRQTADLLLHIRGYWDLSPQDRVPRKLILHVDVDKDTDIEFLLVGLIFFCNASERLRILT